MAVTHRIKPEIVVRMAEWRLAGMTFRQIRDRLEQEVGISICQWSVESRVKRVVKCEGIGQ